MRHMQQDLGQENVFCCSMEVGIKHDGFPTLVPKMQNMPQMQHVRHEQKLEGFPASIHKGQAVHLDKEMHSLRPALASKCVSRVAMETRREGRAELDSALRIVPLLRDVQTSQKFTSMRPESKN